MNPNIPLKHAGLIVIKISVFLFLIACNQVQPEKPNIIWLIAEDISPDLPCYGNFDASTPSINKLAENGIVFHNAFATGPVCSPSRSAFLTGVHQTTLGADFHRTLKKNKPSLPEGVKTLPQIFYEAGYFVDYNGKKDVNFNYKEEGFKDRDWSERKPGQPFFMVLQTFHTHRPFHRHEKKVNPDSVSFPPYYPDHALTRRDWANYLEDIQHLDDWVGEQMQWLADSNLLENTIVVFVGDHGRPHVRDKQFLYDGSLKVPLIISHYNKQKQQKVNNKLISLIDLAPTMLEAANLPVPSYMHGVSLNEKEERKYVFAARDRSGDAIDKMRSVRSKDYLLIKNYMPEKPYMQKSGYKLSRYPVFSLMHYLAEEEKLTPEQQIFMAKTKPEYELYNVKTDPYQLNNIAETEPEVLQEMQKVLSEWQTVTNDTLSDPDIVDLSKKLKGKSDWLKSWYDENGLSYDANWKELVEFWESELLGENPDAEITN